jgi:hypothetical protein
MNEEPKRDPMLREALRDLEGDAVLRDVDVERLRKAILWRAAGPLARLRDRRSRTWRDYLVRWAGALVPAAVAAALALVLLIPGSLRTGEETQQVATSPRDALSLVVSGGAPEQEVVDAMIGSEAENILASAGGAYTP